MKCRWVIRFDVNGNKENGNKEKVLQVLTLVQREDSKGKVYNNLEWRDVVTVDFTKGEDN